MSDGPRCYVRVVNVDHSSIMKPSPWQAAARAMMDSDWLVASHAVIPTELRQQFKFDVTGSVWIKFLQLTLKPISTITVFPLSVVVSISVLVCQAPVF